MLLSQSLRDSLVEAGRVVGGSTGELGLDVALRLVLDWVGIGRVGCVGAGSLALGLSDELLGLGSVLVCGALGDFGCAASVLSSNVTDLGSLLVDDGLGVGELAVDELLVHGVNERDEEDGGGRDETHSPGGSDLFEEVERQRGGEGLSKLELVFMTIQVGTYGNGGIDVFGKDDSLGLDDEKVDELLDILKAALEVFAGQGVVLAGTHLGSQATVEDELAGDFRGSNNWTRQFQVWSWGGDVLPRMM